MRAGLARLGRPADAVPGGRPALRKRRHRGAARLPARRPGHRRPAGRPRHRRLLPVAGQQLQPGPAPGRGRGPGRRRPGRDHPRRDPGRPAQAGRRMTARTLKVALLGCGVVGSEVARLLIGARLELAGIAVRRVGHRRGAAIDTSLLTADAQELVSRPDVDIVVEVIGGIEPARTLMLSALKTGKPVVTANKALLAENGAEIYGAAREYGADLYYEASVAGAIPLLRPLRESLAGDTVHRVLGIVNGTTNYILDRMDSSGAGFAEALEEAQALGYAEADPTADVEGFDAAAKAAILAGLAFHTPVTAADVHREGITEVTAADIGSARALGRVVKLLAICERCDGGIAVRVHPAMIPRSHPLAAVSEAYNAVFVEAESAGRLMFYGAGAGGTPTASAVLGDIVAVARNRLAGT